MHCKLQILEFAVQDMEFSLTDGQITRKPHQLMGPTPLEEAGSNILARLVRNLVLPLGLVTNFLQQNQLAHPISALKHRCISTDNAPPRMPVFVMFTWEKLVIKMFHGWF
jgi:hypothetical protein